MQTRALPRFLPSHQRRYSRRGRWRPSRVCWARFDRLWVRRCCPSGRSPISRCTTRSCRKQWLTGGGGKRHGILSSSSPRRCCRGRKILERRQSRAGRAAATEPEASVGTAQLGRSSRRASWWCEPAAQRWKAARWWFACRAGGTRP